MSMIKKFYTTAVYEVNNTNEFVAFTLGPFFTEQVRVATSNLDFHLSFTKDKDDLNAPLTAENYDLIIPRNTVEIMPNIRGGRISVKPIKYGEDSTFVDGKISVSEIDLLYDTRR